MTSARLQARLDRLRTTSAQRAMIGFVAVAVATASSVATAVASGGSATPVAIIVAMCALAAVAEPDPPVGMIVVAIVALQWVIIVDDPTTAWGMVVALALFVFHALLALMATTPFTGVVHRTILLRWLVRSGGIVAATAAVWALVVVFERRDLRGNSLLTAAALLLVAALAVVVRTVSVATDRSR